jgi:hypothetical protein
MKKLITILCAVLITIGLSAQTTDQGSMLVGTSSNLSYSSFTPDGGDDSENVMTLSGQYGYFFTDNLCGGVGINYMSSDGESATGFGLFGRYYFLEGKMYGHLGYDMGDYIIGGMFAIEDYSAINLGVGYCAWLNDNVTLEPGLMYSMQSVDGETLGATLGIKVGFGIYF